jgi:hypothetical protein
MMGARWAFVVTSLAAAGCGFNENDPFEHQEVVSLEEAPPPISGGTLTATADGRYAIAADPDRHRVLLVDLDTRAVRELALDRGAEPGRVVEAR